MSRSAREGNAAADAGRSKQEADETVAPWWLRSTLPLALLGAALVWVAQPPLRWAAAAPLGLAAWLLLVRLPELPGRRPYRAIYFASLLHWLFLLQGLRHPHWALYFGWFALSLYVACYLPLAIGLTRLAVRRAGWPLMVAAPAVWVSLELLRGHFLSGFSLALVGHTLADVPLLIQTADAGGAYLVGGLLVAVAAALAEAVPLGEAPRHASWRPLAFGVLVAAGACGYGAWRLADAEVAEDEPQMTVALIQGARDVFYEYDPRVNTEMFLAYRYHSIQALKQHPETRLVIWPESSLEANLPEFVIDGPLVPRPGERATAEEIEQHLETLNERFRAKLLALAIDISPRTDTDVLVCGEAIHARGDTLRRYNSALLVRHDGTLDARYYKMHPVAFGEYIPGANWMPWLYDLTPMSAGLSPGDGPVAMQVGERPELVLSPSICFETTVPHLIRRQVAELRREGRMPDALINPSNDGWFHGSSILDLHARCAVFRAVENWRPVLVAANGGLTSWIDARGRVRGRLPRKTEGHLVARVPPGRGVSPYQHVGDLFAWLCAAAAVAGAGVGWTRGRRRGGARA